MSIEDIERALPNGLHDAIMRRYVIDYEKRTLEFSLDVWVGNLESKDVSQRERYKPGILSFEGLAYFVIEPSAALDVSIKPLTLSAGDPSTDNIKPSVSLPETPEGTFCVYLFFRKLNAFMHICASAAKFRYDT
jgi:hypothetical protein